MIMIVKACIFSPSLTRQLHYHSQLDKSVAWFWKSNEDIVNEVPIYMKVAPNIDWSGAFYLFCCSECVTVFRSNTVGNITAEREFFCLERRSTRRFKWTVSNKQIRISSCMTGVRRGVGKRLFTLLIWAAGESKLTARPGTAARVLRRPVTTAWEWLHDLSEDIFAQLFFFFSLTFCRNSCHKQHILMTFMN